MEITAEQMDAIRDAAEALNEIFENLKEKLRELVKKIVDVLTPYLQKVMRWGKGCLERVLKSSCKGSRHGKMLSPGILCKKEKNKKEER